MFTKELAVLVIVLAAVLIVGIYKLIRNKQARHQAQAEREHAERVAQQLKDQQENIGRRIYNALSCALDEVVQGGGESRMRVDRMPNNGKGYSVFVGVQSDRSATYGGPGYAGYPVLSVSVQVANTKGPHIHWNPGVYNPGRDYGVDEQSIRRLIDDSIDLIEQKSKEVFA